MGIRKRHGIQLKRLKIMNKDRISALKKAIRNKDRKKVKDIKIRGR